MTIGLAASVGSLLLFGKIAESIDEHDTMAAIDHAVPALISGWANPRATQVFEAISGAGAPVTLAIIGVLVAVALLAANQRALFLVWAAALTGAALLNLSLKFVFHRPRPDTAWEYLHGQSWSFPSGHALGSLVTYGMLAYLGVRFLHRRAYQVAAVTFAICLVLLVAFSRLYLGVHFLSDVVGGLAAGAVWLITCISVLELLRDRETHATPSGERAGQPGNSA